VLPGMVFHGTESLAWSQVQRWHRHVKGSHAVRTSASLRRLLKPPSESQR